MQCPKCSEKHVLRRMPRIGLLEQKVLSWLGYYPWECSACRKRVMMKVRGEQKKSSRRSHSGLSTN